MTTNRAGAHHVPHTETYRYKPNWRCSHRQESSLNEQLDQPKLNLSLEWTSRRNLRNWKQRSITRAGFLSGMTSEEGFGNFPETIVVKVVTAEYHLRQRFGPNGPCRAPTLIASDRRKLPRGKAAAWVSLVWFMVSAYDLLKLPYRSLWDIVSQEF